MLNPPYLAFPAPPGQMWVSCDDRVVEGKPTRVAKSTPNGYVFFDTIVRGVVPGFALVDLPEGETE